MCTPRGTSHFFFFNLNSLRLIARYTIVLKIFIFNVCMCKCRQAHAVVPAWRPEGTFGNKFCPSTQPRLSTSIGKGFYLLIHLADVSVCLSVSREIWASSHSHPIAPSAFMSFALFLDFSSVGNWLGPHVLQALYSTPLFSTLCVWKHLDKYRLKWACSIWVYDLC